MDAYLAGAGSTGILSRMPDEPEASASRTDSMSGGESTPIVAVVGIVNLPAMRLSGTLTVGAIRDALRSCVIPVLRKLRRLLAGYSRARKAGDATDTDIPAAKFESTIRMGMVAHLLRAGAKWGVVTIYREPDRVAVDHEVNDPYRLDTTAHHHRLANVTSSDGRAVPPDHSAT